jgi:hypothetical protein
MQNKHLTLKTEYLTLNKKRFLGKQDENRKQAVILNTFSVSSSLNPSESALAAILAEVLVGVSALVSFTYTNIGIVYFILTPLWGEIIGWYLRIHNSLQVL